MIHLGASITEDLLESMFEKSVYRFLDNATKTVTIKENDYETSVLLNKKSNYLQINICNIVTKAKYLKNIQKNCDCVLVDISRNKIFIIEAKKTKSNGSGNQIKTSNNWTIHFLNCLPSIVDPIEYSIYFVTSINVLRSKSRTREILVKGENWVQCYDTVFLDSIEKALER